MEPHITELHAILAHYPLDELFTANFMLTHTKFESIDAMLANSGVENIENLLSEQGRTFVSENTSFQHIALNLRCATSLPVIPAKAEIQRWQSTPASNTNAQRMDSRLRGDDGLFRMYCTKG